MDWPAYLIIGGVVLIAAALFLFRDRPAGPPLPPYAQPGAGFDSRPAPNVSADLQARARELLARGQKIQAIKEIREASGLGLKEAKDYVEALERGAPVVAWSAHAAPPAISRGLSIEEERSLREMLARGSKIEAIKRARELTGLGLKEAKDLVDRL